MDSVYPTTPTRWGIFLASFSLCASLVAKDTAATRPLWAKKMQELSQAMSELLPELTSNKNLVSPAVLKKIQKNAKKLKELSHTINFGSEKGASPLPPDADPSIQFLSSLFEREAKHAYSALESGHLEYARGSLRLVTSYCIACHTRTDKGPQFPSFPLSPETSKLSKFEKAQLYTATRQFDKALQEFESLISDKKFAREKQLEWGRAVRNAFTIAVRVKKDPKTALRIVEKVQSLPSTPGLFREYVAAWKKSVQQWNEEKPRTFSSEEELYQEAQRLLTAAQKMQSYPLDHSADVLFLRLSLVAHEMLGRYPQGKRSSEAFYIAGNAYDLLDDHLISPLPEMYYEACIRRSPHQPIAKQCFQRYEANIYFGYTGSAGTSIPTDLQELLKELKTLAAPGSKAGEQPSAEPASTDRPSESG